MVPEFVNPKYATPAKDVFKSPTRLECMMQDFPKLLPSDANIGFSTFDKFFYSPVKNNAADAAKKVAAGMDGACAASGEAEDDRCATPVAAKTLCIPFEQVRPLCRHLPPSRPEHLAMISL